MLMPPSHLFSLFSSESDVWASFVKDSEWAFTSFVPINPIFKSFHEYGSQDANDVLI
jgi:hypothetical protein